MITKRKYYATVDGGEQEYLVHIEQSETDLFKVDIDGEEHVVDFAMTGDNLYSIIIDGRSYDIDITEHGDNFSVLLEGDHYDVEVLNDMKRLMKLRAEAGLEGRQVIEAQMPGMIWKVLVEEGQEVEEGEPLLILVAMKMENEIKSPKAGVVQELFVKPDDTVGAGDKLAIVE
ncbi:biotin/lipoyl-containing protein [Limisalsivibrio acetivorans]|uniref:biotin/lipoyl-containing protein n=1 Tax=Limisalsivibrio acetivorans TaxID=1304888 RepID=UPI0003B55EDC|nr:biotin/lipoyl-containing protein [Limisalsivibrio acetivorans]